MNLLELRERESASICRGPIGLSLLLEWTVRLVVYRSYHNDPAGISAVDYNLLESDDPTSPSRYTAMKLKGERVFIRVTWTLLGSRPA